MSKILTFISENRSVQMSIKYASLFLIGYFVFVTAYAQHDYNSKTIESDLITTTDRFEFYSNFWINQHHFLYEKAKQAEKKEWTSVFDDKVLNALSKEEREVLKNAIEFYREEVTGRSLLFNGELSNLKSLLSTLDIDDSVQNESISTPIQNILNSTKAVYKAYFWEAHHIQNQKIVSEHLSQIRKMENAAFNRIADLAKQPWKKEKVRVDVSYYSNWAGAYTSVNPTHVVITSRNEEPNGDWLELMFHEPTHSIISNRQYAVAKTIAEVSAELNVDKPRNLWHALLFYFSGEAVKELLEKEGDEYELYMFRNEVFLEYHAVIKKHGPDYVQGKVELEEAVKKMVQELNK